MALKTFFVTGANKGIGLEICKVLAKDSQYSLIMGSRNLERGKTALAEIQKINKSAKLVQIDLDDSETIKKAKELIAKEHGNLDVLINNAGMAYKGASKAPFSEQAEVTIKANYTGTMNVMDAFLPIIPDGGRVVTVSSMAHRFAAKGTSDAKKKELNKKDMALKDVDAQMAAFVKAAKADSHQKEGWANSAYGTSKLGLTIATTILARMYPKKYFFSVCPGWCKSDMAGHERPTSTATQGAERILYCVGLSPADKDFESGQHYENKAKYARGAGENFCC